MRGSFLLKGILFVATICLTFLESFGQNVLLLVDEEKGELVVIKKKQMSDILTLDHEYLGHAVAISSHGLQSMRKVTPIDSVHSLVVKNKNFGKALGLPFRVAGGGLGCLVACSSWTLKKQPPTSKAMKHSIIIPDN